MSTVLSEVFALMNVIKSESHRAMIKKVTEELCNVKVGSSSSIGFHSNQMGTQFLGYLFIDGNYDKIKNDTGLSFKKLSDSEKAELMYGHRYIRTINHQCLNPMLTILPNAYEVIQPYWLTEKKMKPYSNLQIDSDIIGALLTAFAESYPFKIIQNRVNLMPGILKIPSDKIADLVYSTIHRINQHGLKNVPSEFDDPKFKLNDRTPDSVMTAVVLSLILLRSSLEVVDQLLYQAYTTDKLIKVDKNNLFNVTEMSRNALSEVVEIKTDMIIQHNYTVILMLLPSPTGEEEKYFSHVESLQMLYSQDYGMEYTIGTRTINANANVYPFLQQSLKLL